MIQSLAEDPSAVVGSTLKAISFQSEEIPVKNWIDGYLTVLRRLYDLDPTEIYKFASNEKEQTKIENHMENWPYWERIGSGVYASKSLNTYSKFRILRELFKLYGLDYDDLLFYVIDKTKKQEPSENCQMMECQEYFLPLLKENLKDLQLFQNSSPARDGQIKGSLGLSMIYLVCVIRPSTVRIELVLNSTDVEKNKEKFDTLYGFKDQIEQDMHQKLVWNRGDSQRQSKIYHSLPEVNLNNRDDWKRIAEFLIIWSRQFYELIVLKYLKQSPDE